MLRIPKPEDYDVSPENGFLSAEPPLQALSDPYYEPWEFIVKNLQGLILSKRLQEVVDRLPHLSTDRLFGEPEWRRAYSVLAFIAHAYIWAGERPMEWIPPPLTVPFMATCKHLQLPPVATYAGLVLWNWKPIFEDERVDTLANLDMIDTFTGSLDEKWFYLISVAIESRGAPLIPLMLHAMEAASRNDRATVTNCLHSFAERLDELGSMLVRMYDNCDPHVFYHRIRPFLAGSKNMADAGLPNGVIFDNGGPMHKQRYVQYSGGSNAQSSLIQFFDVALSVEHRPTGKKGPGSDQEYGRKKMANPEPSFIHEMRKYMPGPHARFLRDVERVANIRSFVEENKHDRSLSIAYDACLAMLRAFRDKHIQIVSRYIVIKAGEAAKKKAQAEAAAEKKKQETANERASHGFDETDLPVRPKSAAGKPGDAKEKERKNLRGTGGTSLIPFLRQARDETGEPAVDAWARRVLNKGQDIGRRERRESKVEVQGLASVWQVDEGEGGGLCLY